MDLDKICRAFKRNRFDCTIFETAEEAAAYLSQEIHDKTVGMGDSMTLENMKMYERLSENNEVYDVQHIENKDYTSKERTEQFLSMARKCLMTDVFLTSANAASETGELVNIDGTGNRVAAMMFGPKKVILIAGINKLAADEESALRRVKQEACPPNCIRLGKKTPCAVTGECGNCLTPGQTICSYTVSTRFSPEKDRLHVILVNDILGF